MWENIGRMEKETETTIMGLYESRSKLPFTSCSLGGSRCAKNSRSIGDVLKLWAYFIYATVKRSSQDVEMDRGRPCSKT